jgi:hypothetical protein
MSLTPIALGTALSTATDTAESAEQPPAPPPPKESRARRLLKKLGVIKILEEKPVEVFKTEADEYEEDVIERVVTPRTEAKRIVKVEAKIVKDYRNEGLYRDYRGIK